MLAGSSDGAQLSLALALHITRGTNNLSLGHNGVRFARRDLGRRNLLRITCKPAEKRARLVLDAMVLSLVDSGAKARVEEI